MTPVFPRAPWRRYSGKAGRGRSERSGRTTSAGRVDGDLMSRVYGDPVEVWVMDGRPSRFVWHDRLYTVHRVLDTWVTTRDWSHDRAPEADESIAREFWQVEAAADREAGVYELRYDGASDTWMLSRAWD